jgi:hypothetical protein
MRIRQSQCSASRVLSGSLSTPAMASAASGDGSEWSELMVLTLGSRLPHAQASSAAARGTVVRRIAVVVSLPAAGRIS